MNKKLVILSLILTVSAIIQLVFLVDKTGLNAAANESIYWSPDRPLTWSDFSGIPDYNNDFIKALTASSIKYAYKCDGDYITFSVDAVFIKDQSWVKEEALTTYHLQHEQVHFDITELYARKLRNYLAKRNFKCHEQAIFENAVDEYLAMWRSHQATYDHETFYSVIESEQEKWNQDIFNELFHKGHSH